MRTSMEFLPRPTERSDDEILKRSLEKGVLEPRLLYEPAISARKWLEVSRKLGPVHCQGETRLGYERCFQEVAAGYGSQEPVVVSLGCGGGRKEVSLLTFWLNRNIKVDYVAFDVSDELVREAVNSMELLGRGVCVHPVVGDLKESGIFSNWLDERFGKSRRRVYLFLGMLTIMGPLEASELLKRVLRPEDFLVVSANMVGEVESREGLEALLPQYDNPETRDWLMASLRYLGLGEGSGLLEFHVKYQPEILFPHVIEGIYRVRDDVGNEELEGSRSAPFRNVLKVFESNRYTPLRIEKFFELLTLKIKGRQVNANQQEGVFWGQFTTTIE